MAKQAKFNPFGTTLEISFEGTRFDGAEIVMELDMPMAKAIETYDALFGPKLDEAGEPIKDANGVAETLTFPEQAVILAERKLIHKWNLVNDEGEAIPITKEGIESMPPALLRVCLEQWQQRVFRPANPLSGKSTAT